MEPISIPLRQFLVSMGFNEHKLDIRISYVRDLETGKLIGKIIAEGPVDE